MQPQLEFTEKELEAIRSEYCKGATDSQFDLFVSECKGRSLRPGAHLVFQLRKAKEFDQDTGSYVYTKKPYWITTISALRLIAERTGKYAGQSEPEYIYLDDSGEPSIITNIPLPSKQNKSLPREPWGVRVKIYRKDFEQPVVGFARFEAVAGTMKRGNDIVLTDMWQKRGPEQTWKCAEADGIRRSFPEEAGSLYLAEEIKNDHEDEKPTAVTPASVTPVLPSVPKVDQTPPVEGKSEPRPGETTFEEARKKAIDRAKLLDAKVLLPEVTETKVTEIVEPPADRPKRTRKTKEEPKPESPVNQDGITDADLETIGTPAPEIDHDQIKQESEEFIAGIDPTPTDEEMKGFIERVRALTKKGTDGKQIQAKILDLGKVSDHKKAPVSVWKKVLESFENPQEVRPTDPF